MLIDVYSHSVKVTTEGDFEKHVLFSFLKKLIQWESNFVDGRVVFTKLKTWYFEREGTNEIRFHINELESFRDYLNAHATGRIHTVIRNHEFKVTSDHEVKIKIKSLFEPREDQIPVINHLRNRGVDQHIEFDNKGVKSYAIKPDNNKTITLRTGGGKTFITKRVMADESLRTFIMMRGGYIDRWVPDIMESFKLKGGELQVVQGAGSLSAIMYNAIDGEPLAHIYLVSTDTYVDYISHYERNGLSETFPIAPGELFERLKIAKTVIDEGHQLPHKIMKFFSYLHVYKHTTLTATLDTMDSFMDKILCIMYPRDERFSGPQVAPHIKVTAYRYQIENLRRVRYTGYKGCYNHTAFENSLLKSNNRRLLSEYLEMVTSLLEDRYIKRDLKGTKALVFFATINMCTKATEIIAKKFPNLNVQRYVSKDKMSVMDDADIIVSTVLSAGTAVDIPNLLTSIMTTAVDSQQSNEQTVGRTRPVKTYPTENPEFIYFVCSNIDKHIDYHRNKERFFKGKVVSHGIEQSHITLGASGSKDNHPKVDYGVATKKVPWTPPDPYKKKPNWMRWKR